MTSEEHISNRDEDQPDTYRIELDTFQGPLDLLLHLIKKNEVDIYDIPVSEIARQYMEYLEMIRTLNLDVASEFLVMASNLIYIKSRMLLPPAEDDEEQTEEDPREELVRRLIEYQKYKKAAEEFTQMPVLDKDVYIRPETRPPQADDDQYVEASLFQLMDSFQKVLSDAEMRQPHEVNRVTFTLEDGVDHIMVRLTDVSSMRFMDLFEGLTNRMTIIVVFLGVLELIKRGQLMAVQKDLGEPLRLVLIPAGRMELY